MENCIRRCVKNFGDITMTDEQINNTCGYDCELAHNCYYKQLKRKEQECEQLKEVLNGTNP